jgi:uncharacterized protein YgiM (DUF1202 family)
MKLIRIALIFGFLLATVAVTYSDVGTMSVQIKEGQLRATPSFLGQVVGTVAYNEPVEALQQQGEWVNVKNAKNQTGWIHQSALAKKTTSMSAGGQAKTGASGQEIALAGKGFNPQVEEAYRKGHPRADYAAVDRMEAIRVSPPQMISFLGEGNITPREGGAK